jgi:hypothetical protein
MKNVNHNPQHTQIITKKTKNLYKPQEGFFLSCSPKEHNEFTMVIAKAQMQKPILKFRTPKP